MATMSAAGPPLNMSLMRGHAEAKLEKFDMKNTGSDSGDDCPPEVVQRLRAPDHSGTQNAKKTMMRRLPKSRRDAGGEATVTLGKRAVGNNPEHHVWSDESRAAGRRRRKHAALLHEGIPVSILPVPSPMRSLSWWRRPPSPLLCHMRPLWAVPPVEGRESPERGAPEDGEKPNKVLIEEHVSD